MARSRPTTALLALCLLAHPACDTIKSMDRSLLALGGSGPDFDLDLDPGALERARAEAMAGLSPAEEEPAPIEEAEPEETPLPPPPPPPPPPAPPPPRQAPALTPRVVETAPPPAPKPAPKPAPPPAPKPPAPKIVLLTELGLQGLEPLPFAQVKATIGKRVWCAVTQQLRGRGAPEDEWIYAGEPLTLVAAEPFNRKGEPLSYNYVKVKTAEGKAGEVQIIYLSRTALRFNLKKPGKLEELLQNAFEEGLNVGVQLHLFRKKHRWDPPFEGEEGQVRRTLEPSFEYISHLVHALVYGTTSGEDQILRSGRTRWAALTEDDERYIPWIAGGCPDDELKRELADYKNCLSSLDNVDYHGHAISRAEREKKGKLWLRGMEKLPPARVKQMDEKELAERDQAIAESQKKMDETLLQCSKEAAELLAKRR